jgi:hypothetical protein
MKAREKKKKREAALSQPVTSDPMSPGDPLESSTTEHLKLENPIHV